MKKGSLAGFLLLSLLLTGCTASRIQEPEFAFRFAENQALDYPTTVAARYFADLVAQRTDGRLRITVYAEAKLGDERSVVEQMAFGGIDFSRVNLSPLSEFDPALMMLQLPFLYRNDAHKWQVLESGIGDRYLEGLSSIGLAGLAWVDSGARSFYTRTPVRSLEDMKGLRIRVQESTLMESFVRSLGAIPVQLRYDQVLSALQTGKIDGAENNFPSYLSTGHFLVAPFVLTDEHTRVPEVIIASALTMQKLSESDQAVIRDAAKEAALYQRELWLAYDEAARAAVLEAGCVIQPLSAEKKQPFEAAATLYADYTAENTRLIEEIAEM